MASKGSVAAPTDTQLEERSSSNGASLIFDSGDIRAVVGWLVSQVLPAGALLLLGFQWVTKKWLDQKFAKRLEEVKTAQAASLKHIQSSIDHQIHRAKKLYDTEFDVLSKSWVMFESLYSKIPELSQLSPLYAEWDTATIAEIEEVLNKRTDFTEDEKIQVLDADEPADEQRVVVDQRRAKAYEAETMALAHFLESNGIFIRREIRDKFKALLELITLAFSEFGSNIRRTQPSREHLSKLRSEGVVLRDELRDLIEGRLWTGTDAQNLSL